MSRKHKAKAILHLPALQDQAMGTPAPPLLREGSLVPAPARDRLGRSQGARESLLTQPFRPEEFSRKGPLSYEDKDGQPDSACHKSLEITYISTDRK